MERQSFLNEFSEKFKSKAGVFMCMSGSAEIFINGQLYSMQRGVACIVSPIISLYFISKSADFEGIYILDELDVFYPVIHSMIGTLVGLKVRNNPCLQFEDKEIQTFLERKKLIDQKRELIVDGISEDERYIINNMIKLIEQELMLEVIHIHFRRQPLHSQTVDKKDVVFYNFIQSLHANFKVERSVAFYANEARLSVGYFTSVVKQLTERTPSEWISTITVIHAKLLLSKTEKNIKEISAELNFPEQFTFRKYFKHHTGLSPKEYRLQAKTRQNKPD